jgi:hypothetical protein
MEIKKYTIGDTVYELLRPTFGLLRHVSFYCRDAGERVRSTDDLQRFLRDEAGRFVAGLITPRGVHPADRDLDAIARAIDWDAEPGLHDEVLTDFFAQPGMETPEGLIKAGRTMNVLAAMILPSGLGRKPAPGATPSTPSSDTSPPSPEAAPSSGEKSSGPAATETSEPASR